MAVVSVTLDGRTAKATFGGRNIGFPVDFAAVARECFEAIAASSPDPDQARRIVAASGGEVSYAGIFSEPQKREVA